DRTLLCPIGRGSVHGPAPQSPSKGRGRLRRRLLPADRRGQRDVPFRPAIHAPLEASRPVHDMGHRLESYEFHRRVAVCGLHRGALACASGWSRSLLERRITEFRWLAFALLFHVIEMGLSAFDSLALG